MLSFPYLGKLSMVGCLDKQLGGELRNRKTKSWQTAGHGMVCWQILTISSPGKTRRKEVIYVICQFLWCKYSHCDQFQATKCEVTEHRVGERYTVAYHNIECLPSRYNEHYLDSIDNDKM